jgi:chorismate mutase
MWQIPIEMKRLFPELPLICDPSHICGNRVGLLSLAQKCADLDYDGVMIETHYKPETALTDKQQQITPEELNKLLYQLVWKNVNSEKQEFVNQLDRLREQINCIDEELLSLISNRMNVAKTIGDIKKNNNITVLQSSRWSEILDRALNKGEAIGLSNDFIRAYMDAIHLESIRIQNSLNENVKAA